MSALTKPQIIEQNGKPAFAVIPWQEYQDLINQAEDHTQDVWFPNEVVKANARGDSLLKAWREYRGLTQAALAEAAGMQQPALARIENSNTTPRATTLARLALALNIEPEQLME